MRLPSTRSLPLFIISLIIPALAIMWGQAAATPSGTAASITLPAMADTYITNRFPAANFGDDNYLEFWYSKTDLSVFGAFLLFRFEIQEALGPEVIIDSATLELYQIEGSGADPVTVYLHPILEPWTQASVNWNNQPDVYLGPFVLAATLDSSPGWKQIDLTRFAENWLAGNNYGIELRSTNSNFQRVFESTEHNERTPRLVVRYHLPQPTATPTDTPTSTPTTAPSETPSPTPTGDSPGTDPDLIITDLWPDEGASCLQIMNTGAYHNRGTIAVGLYLDGALWDRLEIADKLQPGDRWNGCFKKAYTCSAVEDLLKAVVDENNAIPEENEQNNLREERWLCDQEPPLIQEGPLVENLGTESAVVNWTTNEQGDSRVQIGRIAGEFSQTAADQAWVTRHHLPLQNLQPATTYYGQVSSADKSGNRVTSRNFQFTTLPRPDTQRPTITLIAPDAGRDQVAIEAVAGDNHDVSRVEFYLNEQLIFIDYSPPYSYALDSRQFANDDYQLQALAYDLQGNKQVDSKKFTIDNLHDERKPQVTLETPSKDDKLQGDVKVQAVLNDDAGLRKVIFLVDGVNVQAQNLSGEKDKIWTFTWDSRTVEKKGGEHRLGIQVFDQEGKEGFATVDVFIDNAPPPRPLLAITLHQAVSSGNRLILSLLIQNVGDATAKELQIEEYMSGFIAQSAVSANAEYTTYWHGPQTSMAIAAKGDMAPGAKRSFAFTVVPMLQYPNKPQPAIGEPLHFTYKDAAGKEYTQKFMATISQTTGGLSLDEAHGHALKSADYLIISNPTHLTQHFGSDNSPILDAMGRLAAARSGVVGLVDTDKAYEIDALITRQFSNLFYHALVPDNWAAQLHPNFSKPLGGYVLFVGESEIIPSDDLTADNSIDSAPYTDNIYSNSIIGPMGRPELIVGRVIGDNAQTLMAPIEASLSQLNGESGHAFNFDSALLVSGPPAGSFINDVIRVNEILAPRLSSVDVLHADFYTRADTFLPRSSANQPIPHSPDNGLAAADMIGGNQEEIILASKLWKTVTIFDRQANSQVAFPIPLFDGTDRDFFTAGDVRGGSKAELIFGDLDSDKIYIFDSSGTAVSADFDFAPQSVLVTGDLTGWAQNEIIIANPQSNTIAIGDGETLAFHSFNHNFDPGDRLLAADILGGSKDEILLLDKSARTIHALDVLGKELFKKTFSSAIIDAGSAWAAADFFEQPEPFKEEILIAPASHYPGELFVYYYHPADRNLRQRDERIGYDFEAGGILAAGQVYSEPDENWAREEALVAANNGRIYVLDTENFTQRLQANMQAQARDKDIVFWSGHGNAYSWAGVIDSWKGPGFPLSFGDHHPVIMTASCLTGLYEDSSAAVDSALLAETLLSEANGAAVYIGATAPSRGYSNREAAAWLFANWQKGESIGKAFTRLERFVWDQDPLGDPGMIGDWRIWVNQYNLYGDPKFGAPLSAAVETLESRAAIADAADLPTTLTIFVPGYQIDADLFGPGLDDVTIPGGRLWLQPGQLRLPYQTSFVEIPPGATVEDVRLISRSGLQEGEDVGMPITQIDPPACTCAPQPAPTSGDGWYPDKFFDWQVLEGGGGWSTLAIHLYPLQYNPQTAAVQFWSEFRFEIRYGQSEAALEGVILSDLNPDPQTPVFVKALVKNSPDPADLVVSGELFAASSGRRVRGLPLKQIKQLGGHGSLELPLDLSGLAPSSYILRLRLLDGTGRLIDTKTISFQIGSQNGKAGSTIYLPVLRKE